jgi:hypothetical protein
MSDDFFDDNEDEMEVAGTIVHETEKAWLINTEEVGDIWLPKSRCVDNEDGTFSVPFWLARQKGLS